MDYTACVNALHRSEEMAGIPDAWKEEVPFLFSDRGEAKMAFLYSRVKENSWILKRMLCVSVSDGKVTAYSPDELKGRFGADISPSQALTVTDYDSYLAGRDRYVSLFGRLLAESGAPDPETVSGCRELFSRLLPAEVLSKVVGPVCSRR